jgi:hypothetical protein
LSGCSGDDQPVNTDIGTTRVFLVAPQLGPQSFKDPEAPIQVAQWNVSVQDLSLELAPPSLDLTFGEPCLAYDTPFLSPVTEGKCGGGIVVGTFTDVRLASVDLVFTMKVRRAEPLILQPGDDYDGDGVINDDDGCPLVFNFTNGRAGAPPRENTTSCTIQDPNSTSLLNDSDGDGVTDNFDNCLFVPNKDQRDSSGIGFGQVPDLIGDACNEQIAQVVVGGNRAISLPLGPIEVIQPQFQLTYLTVDFRIDESLTCDWDAGFCELDTSLVEFCFRNDIFEANAGC